MRPKYAISAVAEMNKEYFKMKKFADFILGIWGLFIITFITIRLMTDYQSLATIENLRAFLLPILLIFALIPFLYSVTIFMVYDSIYNRLDIALSRRDKGLLKTSKRKIFFTMGLNLQKLNRFSKKFSSMLWGLKNEAELTDILEEFDKDQ
jgi:uncharacterized membrane protein YkvI